ncbi:MAG: outer membrane protein OmpA-like peptidoglycan-associated protein [Oceanospirillaceae bacterium]|jgi:outer membrane protein OmpA-like peptidoglycan-associated protein
MSKKLAALMLPLVILSGCATTQGENGNATYGAIGGALVGALLGSQLDDDGNRDKGIIIGALAGAAAGGAIGNYMDRQEAAMRAQLESERRLNEIEIERIKDDTLRLVLNDSVSFDSNSALVKPSFHSSLNKVNQVLSHYNSSKITIVGHTDSRGTQSHNQDLSERRAISVQRFLSGGGVSTNRLNTQGRGELQPRDTNETSVGRSRNRRVELLVQGVGS